MEDINKISLVTHRHRRRSCTGGSGNNTASMKTFYPAPSLGSKVGRKRTDWGRMKKGEGGDWRNVWIWPFIPVDGCNVERTFSQEWDWRSWSSARGIRLRFAGTAPRRGLMWGIVLLAGASEQISSLLCSDLAERIWLTWYGVRTKMLYNRYPKWTPSHPYF